MLNQVIQTIYEPHTRWLEDNDPSQYDGWHENMFFLNDPVSGYPVPPSPAQVLRHPFEFYLQNCPTLPHGNAPWPDFQDGLDDPTISSIGQRLLELIDEVPNDLYDHYRAHYNAYNDGLYYSVSRAHYKYYGRSQSNGCKPLFNAYDELDEIAGRHIEQARTRIEAMDLEPQTRAALLAILNQPTDETS